MHGLTVRAWQKNINSCPAFLELPIFLTAPRRKAGRFLPQPMPVPRRKSALGRLPLRCKAPNRRRAAPRPRKRPSRSASRGLEELLASLTLPRKGRLIIKFENLAILLAPQSSFLPTCVILRPFTRQGSIAYELLRIIIKKIALKLNIICLIKFALQQSNYSKNSIKFRSFPLLLSLHEGGDVQKGLRTFFPAQESGAYIGNTEL